MYRKQATLLYLCVITLFTSCYLLRQPMLRQNCSALLQEVAGRWKLDTTGEQGYRYAYAGRFYISIIDSVDTAMVLHCLGRPNRVLNFEGQTEYVYWLYSGTHRDGWLYTEYLIFNFGAAGGRLLHISRGDNDRS